MADGQRPAAAACRCCWGVAMGQPIWMSPCGDRVGARLRVLRWTRALALRGMQTWGVGRDANVSFPVLSASGRPGAVPSVKEKKELAGSKLLTRKLHTYQCPNSKELKDDHAAR
jgi:hypothetical protein